MLKDYEAPKIDDATDEEMLEYITVRKDSEPDEIG
jgi:trimethylamine:corrinoid methyltransferase-like protein